MKQTRIVNFLVMLAIAGSGLVLGGCCCCESKRQLMEDFWPSTEERIHWLQQQRAAEGAYETDYIEHYSK